jgi:hypothetical protein
MIAYYNKLQRRMFLNPNTSTSLQTILAVVAHLAEGQVLLEEETLNIELVSFNISHFCCELLIQSVVKY